MRRSFAIALLLFGVTCARPLDEEATDGALRDSSEPPAPEGAGGANEPPSTEPPPWRGFEEPFDAVTFHNAWRVDESRTTGRSQTRASSSPRRAFAPHLPSA